MKVAQLTAALIAAAVMVPAFADGTAAPTPEPVAATPESTAAEMMNPATMAEPAKEPQAAARTIIMLMDPATLMAMMTRGMNPATYTQMGQAAMNPATAQSYGQFMDPALYAKWMAASMNPNFYTGMAAPLMNPNTYLKWGMAPMDPRMWNAGMQMMNPGMYANWMTAPMNPANMNLMMAPMNPSMYTNWANMAVNPQTYGPWGGFMNPGSYGIPGMGGTPAAGVAMPNFFDPSTMFGMMAPGYGQPGVAPAGTFNFFNPNAWTAPGAVPMAQPAPAAHAEDREADRAHPMTFVKDSIITAKIKAKLAADHPGSLAHISVDTDKDGNVWLSGTANTQEEIKDAIDTARNTEGVKTVWPDLTVKSDR